MGAFVQVEEFEPGERSQNWMSVLGGLLLVGGMALGVTLAWPADSVQTILFTPRRVLRTMVGTVLGIAVILAVHEALHGLGMLACGARPRFGAGVMHSGLPYLYTTSDEHKFTRLQFVAIAALPNLLVNLALLVMLVFGPHPSWWIVPLAVHLSGGVGDAWLCWAALTEPRGTLIEDLRSGLRAHRRVARTDRPDAVALPRH